MSTTLSPDRLKKKADIFLPDEIIIEILSRLPAKSVLRFRLVCRGWRDLTSSHSFKELHIRRSIPMVLFAGGRYGHLLLDNWWEPQRDMIELDRVFLGTQYWIQYSAKFSHGGFIVFQEDFRSQVIILNPTSHETVNIKLSQELRSSDIYGIFYHPLLREYVTLWRIFVGVKRWSHPDQGYYKMLNLGSKPCWREISNPWSHRVKSEAVSPVLIGEHLYWLVNREQESDCGYRGDIMEFDIRCENFGLMHCPVPSDINCVDSFKINLLDIDGVLSFVLTSFNDKLVKVSIWKLKDGAQKLWVNINHSIRIEDCPTSRDLPVATAVVGEKLVLFVSGYVFDKLYVCNLERGSTSSGVRYKIGIVTLAHVKAHVMGLASLRNCKSIISMDKEGEVTQCLNM